MANQVNILVAEDDTNIALALKTIIRKATGGNVTVVNDGQAAIDSLQNSDYDLLISDWNMPRITGIDLLAKVRSNERSRELPFLMLTARADADSVKTALGSGVTDYIAKPFDKEKLIAKVTKFLGDKMPAAGAAADESESSQLTVIEAVTQALKKDTITFPVLPEVAFKAVDVINSDDVTLQQVADIIRVDASLTSKIIATANSAYYRPVMPIQDLENAIRRIGLRDSANIILVQATRGMFNAEDPQFEEYQRVLWRHALATANAARVVGRHLEHPFPERLYALGMLHDMGKNLVIRVLMELATQRDDIDNQAIDETLKELHVEFGAVLFKRWQFPVNFIEAATSHHDYKGMRGHSLEAQIIAYANLLTRRLGMSLHKAEQGSAECQTLGKLLGIQPQQAEGIVAEIAGQMDDSMDAA